MARPIYRPLTEQQAAQNRKTYGANEVTSRHKRGFFRRWADNFADPIIRILLIALAVQLALLLFRGGSPMEFCGIATAILVSTLVSTVSECGSEKAFDRMQSEARNVTCTVERADGKRDVRIGELAAGDLVHLQTGDAIPADGVLIAGKVSLDQSPLNGETREAQKIPADCQFPIGEIPCADPLAHPSCLIRGATVAGGSGCMVVLRTGDRTLYGGMMAEMQTEQPPSPLKTRLSALARSLSRFGYFAALLVALSDLFRLFVLSGPVSAMSGAEILSCCLHAVTLGITVVVMAVPEGLPMMITVVLSSNMVRMSRDHVLVRRPVGIETAGSVNILFTDKTGTLTCGKPRVVSFLDGEMNAYSSFSRIPSALAAHYAVGAIHNGTCSLSGTEIHGGNATERALLTFCLPLRQNEWQRMQKGDCVPFDSATKFSAVTVKKAGERGMCYVKGAPEAILCRCTRVMTSSGEIRSMPDPSGAMARLHELGRRAYRVIGLALSEKSARAGEIPANMVFLGFAVIRDDLRPSAARSVEKLQNAGIQVVMITGDNADTAAAIAAECGILHESPGYPHVLTGAELASLSDDEVCRILPDVRVISRALPSDKSRLVKLAQRVGLVAAMTGDGVNDAPALKNADVGFSMGSGTEAAKEAGDICIRDDNIASIVKAVLYGRTIFHSLRKFIVYQLTMNLCAVGVSVIGSFVGIDTPITVIQMLWINMIMDTFSGLAFSGEAPSERYLRQKPYRRDEKILDRSMLGQVAGTGCFVLGLCIYFMCSPALYGHFRYAPDEICFLTGFFTFFVFCGLFCAFCARAEGCNPFRGLFANRVFLPVLCISAAVQAGMVHFGGGLFRTVPLTGAEWKTVLCTAVMVIPADLLRRVLLRLFCKKEKRTAPSVQAFNRRAPL